MLQNNLPNNVAANGTDILAHDDMLHYDVPTNFGFSLCIFREGQSDRSSFLFSKMFLNSVSEKRTE